MPKGQVRCLGPDDDVLACKSGLRGVGWRFHETRLTYPAYVLVHDERVKQYLVEEFGEQIIGYGGFQEWPPSSPDLTPMDVFLWGYLKQQVYETPPPSLQDFQRRITDACANVTSAMLHRVQRARIQMCIVADGEKFEHRK
ncbi:hypothetical protein AVEN_211042-1 [Araneus ventricosus]|uniref:Uncharacterized protein n=1 Tax=Araneus ventricosus TaxID=182803 RepID=A0A4Y2SCZ4_ARAVE|nr:hypothetical protein AVEN_158684-1 [Araneus ventricosus]GBN85693.1 hypothetical protein AVEN_211042-1 [Araneus ventricosus]